MKKVKLKTVTNKRQLMCDHCGDWIYPGEGIRKMAGANFTHDKCGN